MVNAKEQSASTRVFYHRAEGEKIWKIFLFVLAQLTNVTDGQTDRQTPGDSK